VNVRPLYESSSPDQKRLGAKISRLVRKVDSLENHRGWEFIAVVDGLDLLGALKVVEVRPLALNEPS
jgi:hypothetical protein